MLFLVVFPLAMIFGALWDLMSMTIPNWLNIALAAMFVVLVPFTGLGLEEIGLHVAAGALMLVIGMAIFALGWIGGGDAKFIAATALWIGWHDLLSYLLIASIAGGALTLLILMFRRMPLPGFMMAGWVLRLHDPKAGIPYGVALAASGLLVFPYTIWMTVAMQGS